MAQEKKAAPKKAAVPKKVPVKAVKKSVSAKSTTTAEPTKKRAVASGEELVVENFATLTQVVESLAETLEMLVQKTESMAFHIIATQEVLAEVVAANGLNLARVNARIRSRIAAGGDVPGDPTRAIDIAATIASPMPKR